ncbi:MAG: hypothetical protein U1E76_24070 [Planctomycetota bacterium]
MSQDPAPIELSESGRARRASMLRELQSAVVRRRRRRQLSRAAIALALIALAALFARQLAFDGGPGGPREPEVPLATGAGHAGSRATASLWLEHAAFEQILDDPGVLQRYTVEPRAPALAVIGDDELMRLLEQAERSTGLIRIPSGNTARVILTGIEQDDSSSRVPLDRIVAQQ